MGALRQFFATALRWQSGRQNSGYDKMLLLQSLWPLPFDLYLLRFPTGSEIGRHRDAVAAGEHHRVNIVLWKAGQGGDFWCEKSIFETDRIKYFRPDVSMHSVSKIVSGRRYVLSFGWLRRGSSPPSAPPSDPPRA